VVNAIGQCRRFGRQQGGSVAIMFALSVIPLSLAVGAAVDYSFANRAKAALDADADAAALSAVNMVAMSMTAAEAKASAITMFKATTSNTPRVTLGTVTADVTDSTTGRTATLSYTATVPTSFMALANIPTLTLKGSSYAASALPTYIDFHLLLDNTPSMGVAATPADIDTMVANTPDKCAFACHDLSATPKDYYGLAKKLGVTMRIDVVRSATEKLMDTAKSTQTVDGQYRAAIFTFGSSCTDLGLETVTTLTSNLSNAKAKAKNIDLMTIPYQGYYSDQCTNSDATLAAVDKAIAAPGDGSTSASPQKFLFLVSDGVADANNPGSCSKATTSGTRCQEPFDVSYCTTMKNRGVKIAVLYTTYLPLPTNDWYKTWIGPWQSTIGTNMQKCASPGLYFEVSPTEGISEAMIALFQKAVTTARLTR
jgi:Flp pilus assembly protein TadG